MGETTPGVMLLLPFLMLSQPAPRSLLSHVTLPPRRPEMSPHITHLCASHLQLLHLGCGQGPVVCPCAPAQPPAPSPLPVWWGEVGFVNPARALGQEPRWELLPAAPGRGPARIRWGRSPPSWPLGGSPQALGYEVLPAEFKICESFVLP